MRLTNTPWHSVFTQLSQSTLAWCHLYYAKQIHNKLSTKNHHFHKLAICVLQQSSIDCCDKTKYLLKGRRGKYRTNSYFSYYGLTKYRKWVAISSQLNACVSYRCSYIPCIICTYICYIGSYIVAIVIRHVAIFSLEEK